jgi:hypothetical protein
MWLARFRRTGMRLMFSMMRMIHCGNSLSLGVSYLAYLKGAELLYDSAVARKKAEIQKISAERVSMCVVMLVVHAGHALFMRFARFHAILHLLMFGHALLVRFSAFHALLHLFRMICLVLFFRCAFKLDHCEQQGRSYQ